MADGTNRSDRCVGTDMVRQVGQARIGGGISDQVNAATATPMDLLQRVDSQGAPITVSLPSSVPGRKKTSSFQITSVTFGSRLSNDGGDDSADDLDESHTDELSSDLLDVSKTTDYDYSSEDAFSSIKDDPGTGGGGQQQSSVILQRPHCPPQSTSSPSAVPLVSAAAPNTGAVQAPVTTTVTTNTNTSAAPAGPNVSVTVMEAPNVPMAVVQNPDIHWQNRFRVVKIDTGEPFRRGRWLCLDFTDPPPASSMSSETCERESGTGSGNSSSTSSVQHGDSLVLDATSAHNVVTASWSGDPTLGGLLTATGGIMDHVPNLGLGLAVGPGEQPVLPVSIILQTQQQGNLDFTNTVLHMQGRALQLQQQQHHHHPGTPPQPGVPIQQLTGACPVPTSGSVVVPVSEFCSQQPPPPLTMPHQTQAAPPTQPSDYCHSVSTASLGHPVAPPPGGVTTSIPPSQPGSDYRTMTAPVPQSQPSAQQVPGGLVAMQQSPQELQSAMVSSASQQHLPPSGAVSVPPCPSSADYSAAVTQGLQPQLYQAAPTTDYTHPQAAAPPPAAVPVPAVVPPPSQIPGAPVDQQQVFIPSQQLTSAGVVVSSSAGGLMTADTAHQPVSVLDGSQVTGQQQSVQPQQVPSSVPTSAVAVGVAPSGAPVPSVVVTQQQQDGSSTAAAVEEGDPDGLDELEACLRVGPKWGLPTPLSTAVSSISSSTSVAAVRKYSASGASTVAIDNKIEQAMDLVKSHLMFAVREEVDVLKEKITELTDRINQLEYENSVLKASATPETLAKLSRVASSSST